MRLSSVREYHPWIYVYMWSNLRNMLSQENISDEGHFDEFYTDNNFKFSFIRLHWNNNHQILGERKLGTINNPATRYSRQKQFLM